MAQPGVLVKGGRYLVVILNSRRVVQEKKEKNVETTSKKRPAKNKNMQCFTRARIQSIFEAHRSFA